MPVKFEIKAKTGEGKDGKGFYQKIGVVLQGDKGFSIKLNVIPLNWDGFAILQEPEQQGGQQQRGRPAARRQEPPPDEYDDDIPF